MLGTKEKRKKPFPHPPCHPHLKFKRKKIKALRMHAEPSIKFACIKFLFSKLFVTISGLG
jgi:hypothetical protein